MRNKVSALLIALLAFCAFGCGSGTDFNQISGQQGNVGITPPPPPPPEEDSAFLRLAHLSPNAGNVDILVDGTQVATNVAFEAFSNYLEVEAGTTRIQVRATGTTADVIDTNVNLVVDTHTTVAVIGTAGNAGNAGNAQTTGLQAVALSDNVVPTANTLRARLFHTLPGEGPIRLATAEGEVLLGPVTFGQATGYTIIDTGEVETDSINLLNSDGQVIGVYTELRNGQTTLAEALENATGLTGVNTTIAAAGGDAMPLIAALDQPAPAGGVRLIADAQEAPVQSTAHVRVAHMIVGGPDADVFVGESTEPVADELGFEELTEYFEVELDADNQVTITLRPSDAEEGDDLTQTFTLTPGSHNTVTAFPAEAEEEIMAQQVGEDPVLIAIEDDLAAAVGGVKLRFVHASPSLFEGPVALAVREGPDDEEPEFITPPLAFGGASDYALIESANLLPLIGTGQVVVVTINTEGEVPAPGDILAVFRVVRGSTTNIFTALAAQVQGQGNTVFTVFAAGSGEADEENIDLSAVVSVDVADPGNDTLISDGELPEP